VPGERKERKEERKPPSSLSPGSILCQVVEKTRDTKKLASSCDGVLFFISFRVRGFFCVPYVGSSVDLSV